MQGRKFDGTKAAAWCVAGLTLGFASPAVLELLGYGAGLAIGGATESPAIDATFKHFSRQLERDGVKSLERSLRSLEQNLAEHLAKISDAAKAGGPTSSMEREVGGFQHQIDVIRKILGLK
jgi:hypothetical protein